MSLVVHADAVEAVPWKNGGGVTRHLLSEPAGEAWRWRISLADIDRGRPFSAYAGVERWFAVVSGAGVRLSFGKSLMKLGPHDAAIRFDGADAPGCTLIEGRTRDLNLMLRHGARGCMQRGGLDAPWPLMLCFDIDTLTLAPQPAPHSAGPKNALWIGLTP